MATKIQTALQKLAQELLAPRTGKDKRGWSNLPREESAPTNSQAINKEKPKAWAQSGGGL